MNNLSYRNSSRRKRIPVDLKGTTSADDMIAIDLQQQKTEQPIKPASSDDSTKK